ncbi:MAG: hypothetical protein ACO1O3_18505 [Sphingobium sp.]
MRNRLAAGAAIALAGALCGILLWSWVRDTGWTEYRGVATWLINTEYPNTGEPPPPPTGPDPEQEPICDMMRAATGLGPDELAYGTSLPARGFTRIDHDALRRQWEELGVAGRLRVTLFGVSDQDQAAIATATTTDRSRLRVHAWIEQAMKTCEWQARALRLSRPRR